MASLKPTIRQIRYFVAVAEALSFRGAAARLQVSQPTLSHQVLALEEAFGVQLFERSRAGTTLTPAARELLPNSRRVLEEFQGLCDQSESVSRGPAGTYRLGVTPTLGTPLPVDQTGLKVVPLFREPLKLVMSAEHRLAKKRRIGREDLAGESVLTIEEHHHFHEQIQQLCARLKAQTLRDYEGTSLDTLRQMVVMGMGIAFLPALYVRSEIHKPGELRVTTVHDEEIYRTHALAWRSSSPSRQLFQSIAREIRSVVTRDLSKEVILVPQRGRPRSASA